MLIPSRYNPTNLNGGDMPKPDCPACHGTGIIRTYDHIGIVDEFVCDLCSLDDETDDPRTDIEDGKAACR